MHPYILDNYAATVLNTYFEVIVLKILIFEWNFRCTRIREILYESTSVEIEERCKRSVVVLKKLVLRLSSIRALIILQVLNM